ncbi:HNH endonuclease signature motif containing protein [Klenkia terrae]|uniref:HNH endonuclease signature motif containing protein n=1 Tax=Klenkia terrae TaxID=1052259 RepID=UPI001CD87362|nr:HNH endonuclease signature motif containing protein [Klenkia terrae]
MRKLTKDAGPAVLQSKGSTWAADYAAAADDSKPSPWRHREILSLLIAETSEKCAYCESKISSVAYLHVEHILPKSRRPDLVVDWGNLTLACPVCNTAKGAYYDASAPLLNPYSDEPSAHLAIVGPCIEGRPGDELGRRTVDKLKLRRVALLIERAKRIEALHCLIERWALAVGSDRETLAEVIVDELADEVEFCQTLRAYAETQGFIATETGAVGE